MLDAAKNVGDPKPYLGNRAVQWGKIDVAAAGVVAMTRSDLRRYRLRRGDLLVCEGGDVGRAAIWQDELPECYFQKALHRLRPKAGYEVRLMLAFLEYWASVGAFTNYVTQTSIAHLPRDKFILMPLPVPHASEQERLGWVVDDLNRQIATLELMIAKKQAIKQGMMQQLLTGKTRLPGYTEPWSETRLRGVLTFQVGFPFRSRFFDEAPVGVRLIRNRDLRSNDSPIYYSGDFMESYVVRPGDVLVGMDGDFAPCLWMSGSALLNQRVGRIRPDTCVARYMYFALRRPLLDLEAGTGATTVKHLSHKDVESLVMFLPSMAEQHAIAEVLTDIEAEVTALHMRLQKAERVKQGMMRELLTGRTRLPVKEAAS